MTTAHDVRRGVRYWVDGYRSMLVFDVLNLRAFLVLALVIQVLMGAGMAYMYGFYLGDLPPAAQTFLVTGIPALALFPIGFVLVPNAILQHKIRDTYDFLWSLPVPRSVSAASTFTVFTLLSVPGTALALLIAAIRYDVNLSVGWTVLPAVMLCSLMATSVGFALGHAVPDPRVTNLITNLLVFGVLLFSPIIVPISYFPGWLEALHRVLPFYHMANILRASMSSGLATGVLGSYAVVSAWLVGSWVVAAWVVGRRR